MTLKKNINLNAQATFLCFNLLCFFYKQSFYVTPSRLSKRRHISHAVAVKTRATKHANRVCSWLQGSWNHISLASTFSGSTILPAFTLHYTNVQHYITLMLNKQKNQRNLLTTKLQLSLLQIQQNQKRKTFLAPT